MKLHWKLFIDQLKTKKYHFEHWFFKWTKDESNDITLTICGVLNLTKYKEHTIIRWGRLRYESAPKYVVLTY